MNAYEFLSVIHPLSDQRKVTLVLSAYFDESSSHDQSKVIALAGFIGEAQTFGTFTRDWKSRLITPEGGSLDEFKTFSCVHGMGALTPPAWNFAGRLDLAGRLVDVIVQSGLIAIGSSIIREHWEKRWVSGYLNAKSSHPYYLCFEHCVQMAVDLAKCFSQQSGTKETVALVFDEQAEFSDQAKQFYRNYKRDGRHGDWLSSIAFVSSRDFPPIQAADLLAYGTADIVLQRYYPDTQGRDFPIGPVFERLMTNIRSLGGGYDGEALDNLIQHMIEVDEGMIAEEKIRLAKRRESPPEAAPLPPLDPNNQTVQE